ncbi:rRNA pseudouridine synthase [bacterium]|nr:rRNA pseudouridine synthase [bacterium]
MPKTNQKIRINKFLQKYKKISRRAADKLIEEGRVFIDGRPAHKGEIVSTSQKIFVDGAIVIPDDGEPIFLLMNKPAGYICSRRGRNTVFDILPEIYRELGNLSYIGRLDVNTTGALLFTDDGEILQKIIRSKISRIYRATIDRKLSYEEVNFLKSGITVDGKSVRTGKIIARGRIVTIELFEGRWREIRRIFGAIGAKVEKLHRLSFGNISVRGLPSGKTRTLSGREVEELKRLATSQRR